MKYVYHNVLLKHNVWQKYTNECICINIEHIYNKEYLRILVE